MKRTKALSARLHEVFLNGKWIANTNYLEQLSDMNWISAGKKIAGLNSIAALTFHINYYLKGLIEAIRDQKLQISDKYSFDLPPITSQSDWDKLVNDLLTNASYFIAEVELLPDELLDNTFFDERYGTYLRNIEAVIEHSYYHLGQITLIKKMTAQAG